MTERHHKFYNMYVKDKIIKNEGNYKFCVRLKFGLQKLVDKGLNA